jgi:hypothetical protein
MHEMISHTTNKCSTELGSADNSCDPDEMSSDLVEPIIFGLCGGVGATIGLHIMMSIQRKKVSGARQQIARGEVFSARVRLRYVASKKSKKGWGILLHRLDISATNMEWRSLSGRLRQTIDLDELQVVGPRKARGTERVWIEPWKILQLDHQGKILELAAIGEVVEFVQSLATEANAETQEPPRATED